MTTQSKTGFWISVVDADSARYAMKMSSLPIFLFGVVLVGYAGLNFITPGARLSHNTPVVLAAMGGALVVLSLFTRNGKALYLLPYVNAGALILVIFNLWYGTLTSVIFNLIFLGLLLSGLRGWIWLRRHSSPD